MIDEYKVLQARAIELNHKIRKIQNECERLKTSLWVLAGIAVLLLVF